MLVVFFFFQAEDGIRDKLVTGVQTCALPILTVHDLMPVVVLRSPTGGGGWREGGRNRFLRQALKALRQADAYIVGTQWLKHELATWLGNDKKNLVVPFGVDRAVFGGAPGGGGGGGG